MPKLISPRSTTVVVVPKEGEIEITLNINISIDGQVTAMADGAKEVKVQQEEEDKTPHIMPDFGSGFKLNFGKTS
jgi:hypothetical protein